MTKKILIAGFACWSVIAVAQSRGTKDNAASAAQTKDAHPKEAASGQASGRVAPMKLTSAQPAITENKKTESPQAQNGNSQVRVATGDVNGDGHADVAASASASKPAGSHAVLNDPAASEQVKAPRDIATGQASGKRQYQPVIIRKVSEDNGMAARVAKGDVNGDGKADVAINNSHSNIKNTKNAASGQTAGKRMHGDITVTKGGDAAPQK